MFYSKRFTNSINLSNVVLLKQIYVQQIYVSQEVTNDVVLQRFLILL